LDLNLGERKFPLRFDRGSRALWLVSAGFILPTIAKVFLVDTSGLDGTWRAMSVIGLGGASIGVGITNQRFEFRTPPSVI